MALPVPPQNNPHDRSSTAWPNSYPPTPLDHLLGDDVWTKVNIEFYRDAQDGVFKVLE